MLVRLLAVENVDQLTVTEHALVHDLLTYENRTELLTRVEPRRRLGWPRMPRYDD